MISLGKNSLIIAARKMALKHFATYLKMETALAMPLSALYFLNPSKTNKKISQTVKTDINKATTDKKVM